MVQKTWLKNEMLSSRRISHVSIAQRFTVLSASFPRDFYTACAATPRPSFPSIHPRLSPRAYFVNHPAKFAPEPDVYGCCQLIPSKCSNNDLADLFFFSLLLSQETRDRWKGESISEKCLLKVSIATRCDLSKFSNHAACDSIFSQTDPNISHNANQFPSNCQVSGVTVLREEFPESVGNSSEKVSKSARTERVISKARTVAFEGLPPRGFLSRHERGNVTSTRTGGITMRRSIYGKLNICSRRKKVIVSEYIFRWRRGTHSWRDALRDLINSRSCIRTEIRIYIPVCVCV